MFQDLKWPPTVLHIVKYEHTNNCHNIPDSKVHGANMGSIWGRQDPGGPHVGPMNLFIWDSLVGNVEARFLVDTSCRLGWHASLLSSSHRHRTVDKMHHLPRSISDTIGHGIIRANKR